MDRSDGALSLINLAFAHQEIDWFNSELLTLLQSIFGSDAVSLQLVDDHRKAIDPQMVTLLGLSQSATDMFRRRLFKQSPLTNWLLSCPDRALPLSIRKEEVLPDEGLSSMIYKCFLQPNGLRYTLMINLRCRDNLIGFIGLHRSPQSRRFDEDEREFAALLARPLGSALSTCLDAAPPHSAANDERIGKSLTLREFQVAKAVSKGLRNKEIARLLSISENTVECHLKSTFRKIGARSRVDLVKALSPALSGQPHAFD